MLSCTSSRVTIAFPRTAPSFFQAGLHCCSSCTIRAFCAHILTHFRRLEFLNCRDWIAKLGGLRNSIGALLWFRLTPSTGGLCLFACFAKNPSDNEWTLWRLLGWMSRMPFFTSVSSSIGSHRKRFCILRLRLQTSLSCLRRWKGPHDAILGFELKLAQVEGLENDTEEVVLYHKVTVEPLTALELCLSQT